MSETAELVKRLRYLISLDAPEHGGPYQGLAARSCLVSMREAADLIDAQAREIEGLKASAKGKPRESGEW